MSNIRGLHRPLMFPLSGRERDWGWGHRVLLFLCRPALTIEHKYVLYRALLCLFTYGRDSKHVINYYFTHLGIWRGCYLLQTCLPTAPSSILKICSACRQVQLACLPLGASVPNIVWYIVKANPGWVPYELGQRGVPSASPTMGSTGPIGVWGVSDGNGGAIASGLHRADYTDLPLTQLSDEVLPPGPAPMIGSTMVTSIIWGGTLSKDSGHIG